MTDLDNLRETIKKLKEIYGEDLIVRSHPCPGCGCENFPYSVGGEICPSCDCGYRCPNYKRDLKKINQGRKAVKFEPITLPELLKKEKMWDKREAKL